MNLRRRPHFTSLWITGARFPAADAEDTFFNPQQDDGDWQQRRNLVEIETRSPAN